MLPPWADHSYSHEHFIIVNKFVAFVVRYLNSNLVLVANSSKYSSVQRKYLIVLYMY